MPCVQEDMGICLLVVPGQTIVLELITPTSVMLITSKSEIVDDVWEEDSFCVLLKGLALTRLKHVHNSCTV